MYGSVFASTSAPWSTACGAIPCVMSITCASGAILVITPWQMPTKSSSSPKSVRKVMTTAGGYPATARTRLATSGDSASRRTRRPGAPRGRRRLGPDRDDGNRRAERREHARRRAGREHDEVALEPRGERPGPVEHDEVGVELLGEQRPCALGAGEEHAAGGAGQLGEQPFLRRDAGTRSASPHASAVARPIAATRAARPVMRRVSSRAPAALVRTTQS